MAVQDYTEEQLQTMVMDQMNKVSKSIVTFVPEEAQMAYHEAVRECKFSVPESSEEDSTRAVKYQALVLRMRRWFLVRLLERYSTRFDAGEIKQSQVVGNLTKIIETIDKQFDEIKATFTYLFMDGSDVFGEDLVVAPGLIEDRIGQPYEDRTA